MFKSIKKISVLFLIVIGLSSCAENNYVEYKPHYLSGNNEHKYYGESELDSIEFKNTIQVLDFYCNEYKTKNGNVILITKELNQDWTLLWNYTTKANDNEWLKTHKPE
jgi:hypothetical protein